MHHWDVSHSSYWPDTGRVWSHVQRNSSRSSRRECPTISASKYPASQSAPWLSQWHTESGLVVAPSHSRSVSSSLALSSSAALISILTSRGASLLGPRDALATPPLTVSLCFTSDSLVMSPQQVYAAIAHAAKHQLATLPELEQIRAAGLESVVLALLDRVAANAANPIVMDLEDAIDAAVAAARA